GYLLRRHPTLGNNEIFFGACHILRRSQVEPFVCLHIVPGHTVAFGIAKSHIELSSGMILLSCLAKPFYRFCVILRHALPSAVTDAQIVLSVGEILFGSFT